MKTKFLTPLAAVVLMALVAGGCGTFTPSTVESRKKERYAAYQALPPEFRQAADSGSLKAGMNADAVYIAWGNPSQIVSGGNAAGETVTWIYRGNYTQAVQTFGYRLRTEYISSSYVRAQAVFSGGVVREWQTFPRP